MLTRQQKRTLITVAKFVVPALFMFMLVTASLSAYTIRTITHPPRTNYAATLEDYKLIGIWVPKTDESWSLKGGGQATGWFLRASTGAPAIILSHSYGQNLADMLSLGVALQRAGYHVLLYDLRAHGQSKLEISSLGDSESDDLLSAMEHIKSLKDQDGNQLIDKDRIGLYGVSIGGYASLVAASKDQAVKAIVVDAIYPDVPTYVQVKVKQFSGLRNGFIDYFSNLSMKLYSPGKFNTTSAMKAVSNFTEIKQLYILGKDTGDLQATTSEIYKKALASKESVEVPHSRINILYKNDQDVYDPVVVDFFRRPDVMPPISAQSQTPPLNAELDQKKQ